jgi:hypothetical protein
MVLFLTASALALSPAAAQDCAEATSPAQLEATLQAAEQAWTSADEDAFLLRMEEAVLQLPCVDAILDPQQAFRYHRDLGLLLFASQEAELAMLAFGAARRIAPESALPEELASAGHPAQKLYESAAPDATTEAVPAPDQARALFDGSPGPRPTAVNTIFQLEADGGATLTRYLRPDTGLPDYDIYVPPKDTGPKGWHFAAGAGALAAASGSLLMVARNTQASFLDSPPANQDDLDALYKRNRACSTSSAILAGTAGALGVAAVFTW